MPEPLTPGFVSAAFHGGTPTEKPVVQVLKQTARFGACILAISDGIHYIHAGWRGDAQIANHAVIRLDAYDCITIGRDVFVAILAYKELGVVDVVGTPFYIALVPATPVPRDVGKAVDTRLSVGFVDQFHDGVLTRPVTLKIEWIRQAEENGEIWIDGVSVQTQTALCLTDGVHPLRAFSYEDINAKEGDLICIKSYSQNVLWMGNRNNVPAVLEIDEYEILSTKRAADEPLESREPKRQRTTTPAPATTDIRDLQHYESQRTVCVVVCSRTSSSNKTFAVVLRDSTDVIWLRTAQEGVFDRLVPGGVYYITGARLVLSRDMVRALYADLSVRIEPCSDVRPASHLHAARAPRRRGL